MAILLTKILIFLCFCTSAYADVTTGLVSLWTLDEGSGNVTDSIGGLVGTPTGTTVVSGIKNNSRNFNSSSDIITITSSAALNQSVSISVAAWIKTSNATGIVVNKDNTASNRQYSMLVSSNSARFLIFQTSATFSNANAGVVNDGKWHLIIGTCDTSASGDGKSRMYVDGVLTATGTTVLASIFTSATDFTIGQRQSSSLPLAGNIDDVRVYSRALSAADARELYNQGFYGNLIKNAVIN